jgi:hypothetical protein
LGEAHLRRILQTYAGYYNKIRTHRSLDKDAPAFRPVQRVGNIASHAILGGFINITYGFRFCYRQANYSARRRSRPTVTVTRAFAERP